MCGYLQVVKLVDILNFYLAIAAINTSVHSHRHSTRSEVMYTH